MVFVGDLFGAAIIGADGAVGAVTVVGVLPAVTGSSGIGGIFQCARDAAGHGEIVAHFILIVVQIGALAVDKAANAHIISGAAQISRDITIEIQAVQIVALIESVVPTYLRQYRIMQIVAKSGII